eukprot:6657286-Prorocentrum_lima.AAC.1
MTSSLVGSEMCIRDRQLAVIGDVLQVCPGPYRGGRQLATSKKPIGQGVACLLCTSDAADDM